MKSPQSNLMDLNGMAIVFVSCNSQFVNGST